MRDDIYCGAPSCTVCNTSGARLSASPSTILVLDTNVVLNQVCFFALLLIKIVCYAAMKEIFMCELEFVTD